MEVGRFSTVLTKTCRNYGPVHATYITPELRPVYNAPRTIGYPPNRLILYMLHITQPLIVTTTTTTTTRIHVVTHHYDFLLSSFCTGLSAIGWMRRSPPFRHSLSYGDRSQLADREGSPGRGPRPPSAALAHILSPTYKYGTDCTTRSVYASKYSPKSGSQPPVYSSLIILTLPSFMALTLWFIANIYQKLKSTFSA